VPCLLSAPWPVEAACHSETGLWVGEDRTAADGKLEVRTLPLIVTSDSPFSTMSLIARTSLLRQQILRSRLAAPSRGVHGQYNVRFISCCDTSTLGSRLRSLFVQ